MAGVRLLKAPLWADIVGLWHGFSTRLGGVSTVYSAGGTGELNLGLSAADEPDNVWRNRRLLAEAATGSAETPLRTVRQVHSAVSLVVGAGQGAGLAWQPHVADGLMTAERGILLAIQTADCIPVLVADRRGRAVAAFHAGWRGTVAGIVEAGVAQMVAEFGCDPGELTAAIGPGIGACCYQVGDEVWQRFGDRFEYAAELFTPVPGAAPDQRKLDLAEANRRQLVAAGVPAGAIALVGGCTSCRPDIYFSHRAEKGHAGRMMTVIGLR